MEEGLDGIDSAFVKIEMRSSNLISAYVSLPLHWAEREFELFCNLDFLV